MSVKTEEDLSEDEQPKETSTTPAIDDDLGDTEPQTGKSDVSPEDVTISELGSGPTTDEPRITMTRSSDKKKGKGKTKIKREEQSGDEEPPVKEIISAGRIKGKGKGKTKEKGKVRSKGKEKVRNREVDLGDESVDDGTSGYLLNELAEPQVFEGPEVDVQQTIVDRLEEAIPLLDKTAGETYDRLHNEFVSWEEAFQDKKTDKGWTDESPQVIEHRKEKERWENRIPPSAYDTELLYLGTIKLTKIPKTPKGEPAMIKKARLKPTDDHSLGKSMNAGELPKLAKVTDLIVRNTLQTMIKARQIEYLRRSGFVGKGWKVLIEVHYYRSRDKGMSSLHKDTLGQTLFVNLNYTNQNEAPGPEWVLNPPLEKTHEDTLQGTMPKQFREDLDRTRQRDEPTTIQTGTLPMNGVVSFVDETIHHSTPMLGHRGVRIDAIRTFLEEDGKLKRRFLAARRAYDACALEEKDGFRRVTDREEFKVKLAGELPKVKLTKALLTQWRALTELCSGRDNVEVKRPALLEMGLTNTEIDRLLSGYGPDTYNTVSIPKKAREDKTDNLLLPMKSKKDGRPLQLQRQMSQLALKGQLPPKPKKGVPRRFFRTWVRVVRDE